MHGVSAFTHSPVRSVVSSSFPTGRRALSHALGNPALKTGPTSRPNPTVLSKCRCFQGHLCGALHGDGCSVNTLWIGFQDRIPHDSPVLYSRVCLSHICSLIYSSTYSAFPDHLLCAGAQVRNSPIHKMKQDEELSSEQGFMCPTEGPELPARKPSSGAQAQSGLG